MSTNIATDTAPPGKNQRRSKWREAIARVAIRFWFGRYKYLTGIGYLILLSVFWLSNIGLSSGSAATVWQPPGDAHIFGINALGQDVFKASLAAGAKPLSAGILGAFLGVGISILIGWWIALSKRSAAGFNWLEKVTRITGFVPALAGILLIACVIEPGFWKVVFFLTIVVVFATVDRIGAWYSELEERGDTLASTVLGLTRSQIIRGNHLSFVTKRGIALACGLIPALVLGEVALSFVGFGIGNSTWGALLASGREIIFEAPWLTIYPGIVITLSLIALATLGWMARKSMDGEIPPRLF